MQKATKGKLQKAAPFWRERGTDVRRWIVDSTLFEYGKAC